MNHLLRCMPARLYATSACSIWNFPWHVMPGQFLMSAFRRVRDTAKRNSFIVDEDFIFFLSRSLSEGDRYVLTDHVEYLYAMRERGYIDLNMRLVSRNNPGQAMLDRLETLQDAVAKNHLLELVDRQASRLGQCAFAGHTDWPDDTLLPALLLSAPGMEMWSLRGDRWIELDQHVRIVIYYRRRDGGAPCAEVFSSEYLDDLAQGSIRYVIDHALVPVALDLPEMEVRFLMPPAGGRYADSKYYKMVTDRVGAHVIDNDDGFIQKQLDYKHPRRESARLYRQMFEKKRRLWA